MKETTISISIAGNSYPVKVKSEDEQVIVKAARLINDKIKALKETYVVSDKRDLLAMCALQLATQNIQMENKTDSDNVHLAHRLVEMESFITDYLKKSN
ncbi:MAG: cell division protein ZapA [Bacteroidetes bacterium]|nr:cell division protein ZapA [Bacteroidota bacterium]